MSNENEVERFADNLARAVCLLFPIIPGLDPDLCHSNVATVIRVHIGSLLKGTGRRPAAPAERRCDKCGGVPCYGESNVCKSCHLGTENAPAEGERDDYDNLDPYGSVEIGKLRTHLAAANAENLEYWHRIELADQAVEQARSELADAKAERDRWYAAACAYQSFDNKLTEMLEGQPEAKEPASLHGRFVSYVERLKAELDAYGREIARQEKRIDKLRQDNSAMDVDLYHHRSDYRELRENELVHLTEISALTAENERLKEDIDDTRRAYRIRSDACTHFRTESDRKTLELVSLKRDLVAAQDSAAEMIDQRRVALDKLSALTAEAERLKESHRVELNAALLSRDQLGIERDRLIGHYNTCHEYQAKVTAEAELLRGLLNECLTCDGNIDNPELEASIRSALAASAGGQGKEGT